MDTKNFVLYTFQFTPTFDENQTDLFKNVKKKALELMEKKNTIFDSIIDETKFIYRRKLYPVDIKLHQDDFVIMRLANPKSIKREKNFRILQEDDEPSCYIIIDNREDVQKIAIEDNPHAFQKTDTVRNILIMSFNEAMRASELSFSLSKEYLPSEFWDICNKYRGKVTNVTFSYQYPNLGRAHEEMMKMLKDSSTNTNSTKTVISYENKKGLLLKQDDEVISGCVNDSSQGGTPIKMKIKGLSKIITTGKTKKEIKIEEVDVENGNEQTIKSLLDNI